MVHILFSFLLLSPPPFLPQMRLKFVAFGGGARPKGKGGAGPNPLQSLQLLLSNGKQVTTFTDALVVSLFKSHDEVMRAGDLCSLQHLFFGGVQTSVAYVVTHTA